MKTIINVKCLKCGAEGYNPRIPKGHVIDTCGQATCQHEGAIGFKNGRIDDARVENLYMVDRVSSSHPLVDANTFTQDEIEINDLLARASHAIHQKEYRDAERILKTKELEDQPGTDYLLSKIYFKKLGNTCKGVTYLKSSAEKGYPLAMAEYGYILVTGLYGVFEQTVLGLDYLAGAASTQEALAGAYLAHVYQSGLYRDTEYEDVSDEMWFAWIARGLIIGDSMANTVIGFFYYQGMGCTQDRDRAMKHFEYAADSGHVLAMGFLIDLLYEDYRMTKSEGIKDRARAYAMTYLEQAEYRDDDFYRHIEDLFKELNA